MKLRAPVSIIVFMILITAVGCSVKEPIETGPRETISIVEKDLTESTPKESKSPSQSYISAEWASGFTIDDAIRCSSTCFMGTVTRSYTLDEESQFVMEVRIEKILAGNVPDETVFCYFLNTQDFGGSKEKEYELEKKYLFLMDKTSSLFYPHDKYHAPSDYCLNLSDNIYRHMGEKLAFDNEDEICQYVQNRLSSQTAEKDLDRINGKWSDSEYIAVIQLKDILHKASSEFSGTCYIAEVLTVESGNEKDIVRSDGQLIQVTLEDAKTEVGKTYRAGFSLKGGAKSVYTQEGFETIEEIKDGSPL